MNLLTKRRLDTIADETVNAEMDHDGEQLEMLAVEQRMLAHLRHCRVTDCVECQYIDENL